MLDRHSPVESTHYVQFPIVLDGRRSIETYSHSIINEPSTLLIRKAFAAASQVFTVTLAVNP